MYPTFENATLEFQAFLAQQGWPPQVFWIRPEDARLRRRRINVRSMSRDVGEAHAREVYSRAVSARLGVMLEAVCRTGGLTFARVVRPIDEDASSRGLFPDGLKLSVPVSPLEATIASRWTWPLLAMANHWPLRDEDVVA